MLNDKDIVSINLSQMNILLSAILFLHSLWLYNKTKPPKTWY